MKTFCGVAIILGAIAIVGANPLLAKVETLSKQRSQVPTKSTVQAPGFRLPAPSGSYAVGTTAYYLVDSSRKETYSAEIYNLQTQKLATTPRATDSRELMVFIWYPAKSQPKAKTIPYIYNLQTQKLATTPRATDSRELMVFIWYPAKSQPKAKTIPYIDEGFALATAESMGANFGVSPEQFVKLVTQTIQTNAIPKAELANKLKRYPVVIFSPGFGATPKLYTIQLEQLASYGYVVVAVNPTYEVPVLFPDGQVITQSSVFDFSSANKQTEQRTFNQAVAIRAKDIVFVLNELNRLNIKDPQRLFTERLDLSRVGIFGHSLGGDTAIEAMWRDRRLKAGINIDGGSYGKLLSSGNKDSLNRPFLGISHDGADDALRLFYQRQKNNAYRLTVKGSKHTTFTDFGLILPAFLAHSTTQAQSQIQQAIGSIDPQRAAKIASAYTLAFFDQYLKNKSKPLLRRASPEYPEVLIESRK